MSEMSEGPRERGNQAHYALGTSQGWKAFQVVRWHGVDEISQPFEYELTLQRDANLGAVDLDDLVGTGASFWIATEQRWRVVHGIVAEVEELERTRSLFFYRLLLVPPIWAAKYRRRCRTFVDWTLRQVVDAVLMNIAPETGEPKGGLFERSGKIAAPTGSPGGEFKPPSGAYRWAMTDPARIDDATAYPYVVQYNESDLDFLSRLLEREGLSYYFEHGDGTSVMVIADAPGQKPPAKTDERVDVRRLSESGQSSEHEHVVNLRSAKRMRSRVATAREYDWRRSRAPLEAEWIASGGDRALAGSFEFPAGDEQVQGQPCSHAAQIRLDRFDVEREVREGAGNVRTLEPGHVYTFVDADHLDDDADLVIVRIETFATELAPPVASLTREPFGFAGGPAPRSATYENRFLAIPASLTFRPPMRTPAPRIHGVQTAMVTAEERSKSDRPEIHADKYGCVRVRFPWDQRPDKDDGTPTSCWMRVSQYWAGSGFGALYTPRVGHEVLVAYREGDPERPIVVGRVYNAQTPPPYDPEQYPARSTVKSHSSPQAEGFNEIRFEDTAKLEEIFVHAQRNLNEVVLSSHSTGVGGDQSNSVGGNQTNAVKGHREHTVNDYETVTVVSDRTTNFQANEHHNVSGERATRTGANDNLTVGGWHNVKVGAGDTLEVAGKRDVTVKADYTVKTSGDYTSVAGVHIKAEAPIVLVNGKTITSVHGGVSLYLYGGTGVHINAGTAVYVEAPTVNVSGDSTVNVTGGEVNIKGGTVNLNC